jgi:hypothetical protein
MMEIKKAKPFGGGSHIIMPKKDEGEEFIVINKKQLDKIIEEDEIVPSDEEAYEEWKKDLKESGLDLDK